MYDDHDEIDWQLAMARGSKPRPGVWVWRGVGCSLVLALVALATWWWGAW